MHLTPGETEKLLLFLAGELSGKKKRKRAKLNHLEAIAPDVPARPCGSPVRICKRFVAELM